MPAMMRPDIIPRAQKNIRMSPSFLPATFKAILKHRIAPMRPAIENTLKTTNRIRSSFAMAARVYAVGSEKFTPIRNPCAHLPSARY